MTTTSMGPISGFSDGPDFWFAHDGLLWFGHDCAGRDREYTLPQVLYEVTNRESITVTEVISCGACGTRGNITSGQWIPLVRNTN